MSTETIPGERRSSPARAPEPPPLSYGALTLYLAKRSVQLDGQEIDLTPKEYDLFVLLASHPGWVFKREVLLQQIWGDSYEGFDRTIDNHITRLRKQNNTQEQKIAFITLRCLCTRHLWRGVAVNNFFKSE
jgi:DNA-binding response OmpR family regulator